MKYIPASSVSAISSQFLSTIGLDDDQKSLENTMRSESIQSARAVFRPRKGVVLAGGKSIRFGSDKRLEPVNGKQMLLGAIQLLSTVVQEVFISVGSRDDVAVLSGAIPELKTVAENNRVIIDTNPDHGPLGGVLSAFQFIDAESLFFLPVDLPFLTETSLGRLLSVAAGDESTQTLVVIAESDSGRVQPLAGIYSRRIVPDIEAAIQNSELSVVDFLGKLAGKFGKQSVRVIQLPGDELHNVNSAGDLH